MVLIIGTCTLEVVHITDLTRFFLQKAGLMKRVLHKRLQVLKLFE